MLLRGIIAVIISSVAYGFLPVCIKTAIAGGMNSESIVFFRFFFAALISAAVCLLSRKSLKITLKQFAYLLVYGILGFGLTAFLLTVSYRFMQVGLATMLHFCYPIFVAGIMVALFKEKLTADRIAAIFAVAAGLAFMMEVNASFSLKGTVFALFSGLTYAVYIIAVKKSVLVTLPIMTNIFYVTLFSSLFFLLKSFVSGGFTPPPDFKPVFAVFMAGFVCTVVSLALLTYGIRQIGSTRASVVNMIEPMTSIVAGAILYGERLSGRMIIGCFFIMLGTVLISLPEHLFKKKRA